MPPELSEDTTRLTDSAGRSWIVRADWASFLFDAGDLLPDCIADPPSVIRRTESREVAAVRLRGRRAASVIVKSYTPRGALDGFLRGSVLEVPAQIEWRVGRAVAALGLPVAEPLAVGWETRGLTRRRSWIVVAEVPAARDLAAVAADPGTPPSLRRRLLLELADLWRALHDRGVRHDDPNLENFLVTPGQGGPKLVLIDLRRVRLSGAPLDRVARAESLGRLYPTALGTASFSDQMRFLRRYLGPGAGQDELRWFREEIAREGGPILIRRAIHRMEGALRGDRRYATRDEGGLRWHVRRDAADPALARLLGDPEAAFGDPASVIKSGRSAKIARVPPFVIKRFNQKRPLNQLVDRVRLDRARRNLALAALLDFLRIRTPRGLAAAAVRRGGLVKRGYLVTEEVAGGRSLAECLRHGEAPAGALEAVGSALARLHAWGFAHRDLKATNVLVDGAGRAWLVDLDGIRRRIVTEERRAADLGRLFRDFSAYPARERERVEAVLKGYGREAPREETLRLFRRFAAPQAS
jgi:tRNA A-37 threonylcarbamoyl transferase component Bud32